MRIDQAVFGDLRGAHGLVGYSGDGTTARAVLSRTDLPDQMPPGLVLPPYLSGFSVANRFVLTRTRLDSAASRAGMVQTHALILDHADLSQLQDLRPLFDRLNQGPPPGEIAGFNHLAEPTTGDSFDLLYAAADALVRGPRPVIFDGTAEEFEAVMAALWARFTPEQRQTIHFRITFGRRDLAISSPPDLVWSPHGVRWPPGDVMLRSSPDAPTEGAAFLIGGADREALLDLRRDLEIPLADFSHIEQLGRIQAFSRTKSVAQVAGALRIANRLQPDPARGQVGKTRLIEALIAAVVHSGLSGLPPLRNLVLSGFADAGGLWSAVANTMAAGPSAAADPDVFPALLKDAEGPDQALPVWQDAVRIGWSRMSPSSDAVQAAFAAFADEPERLLVALNRLPVGDAWDQAIAAAFAESAEPDPGAAEILLQGLAAAGRSVAHAELAGKALAPEDALARQLSLPGDKGLDRLIRRVPKARIIELAAEQGDARIVKAAAPIVAGKRGLLGGRSLASNAIQRLWAAAFTINTEAWSAPANPAGAARIVFTEVGEGRPVAPGLIEALSASPLADLSAWDERAVVWPALTGSVREKVLAATADGWLKQLEASGSITDLEEPLRAVVLEPGRCLADLMRWATEAPDAGIRLFDLAPELDDRVFEPWISRLLAAQKPIPVPLATRIGDLVARRAWKSLAHDLLYAWRSGNWPSLKPALDACADLLNPLDRFLYGLRRPTESELWQMLEDVAATVWPHGPEQGAIWSRAGGKAADLPRDGTGRDRWRATLGRVRHGGSVRPGRLVKEMLKDVPANNSLAFLVGRSPFNAK